MKNGQSSIVYLLKFVFIEKIFSFKCHLIAWRILTKLLTIKQKSKRTIASQFCMPKPMPAMNHWMLKVVLLGISDLLARELFIRLADIISVVSPWRMIDLL